MPVKKPYVHPATLDDYMTRCDNLCWQGFGMSIYDLPDIPYADLWEDGVSVAKAVKRAIREGGGTLCL
jgi:hypothetical protein